MKTLPNSSSAPIIFIDVAEVESLQMENFQGLTKREYFAAVALQGILAGRSAFGESKTNFATAAVKQADELINALNQ